MQAFRSLSKCIAAICEAVPDSTFPAVDTFITDIKVCVLDINCSSTMVVSHGPIRLLSQPMGIVF